MLYRHELLLTPSVRLWVLQLYGLSFDVMKKVKVPVVFGSYLSGAKGDEWQHRTTDLETIKHTSIVSDRTASCAGARLFLPALLRQPSDGDQLPNETMYRLQTDPAGVCSVKPTVSHMVVPTLHPLTFRWTTPSRDTNQCIERPHFEQHLVTSWWHQVHLSTLLKKNQSPLRELYWRWQTWKGSMCLGDTWWYLVRPPGFSFSNLCYILTTFFCF